MLVAAVAYAFWPRATLVEVGEASRGPMQTTIDEEARTRLHEPFVVTAPVAGRLMRVAVEPGDSVKEGAVIARMRPAGAPMLDARSRATAEAGVDAAEAALGAARAELESALADLALAKEVLDRRRRLRGTGAASQSNLDEAQRTWRAAKGAQEAARATIAMREADLRQARARLIATENALMADASQSLPIKAPVSGRILEVRQKSETSLQAGADILEIGNVAKDLEIVVELLSTDAVRVSAGDPVVIDDWGGEGTLDGVVRRIDPSGFTKVSALGVEEQRVNAVIGFSGPFSEREALGANYRVEVSIVTWREENVLSVPSSALFRDGDGWAVFVIEGGRARLRALEIGRNNGIRAQVLKGLDPTTPVILFPGPELSDGEKVKG